MRNQARRQDFYRPRQGPFHRVFPTSPLYWISTPKVLLNLHLYVGKFYYCLKNGCLNCLLGKNVFHYSSRVAYSPPKLPNWPVPSIKQSNNSVILSTSTNIGMMDSLARYNHNAMFKTFCCWHCLLSAVMDPTMENRCDTINHFT